MINRRKLFNELHRQCDNTFGNKQSYIKRSDGRILAVWCKLQTQQYLPAKKCEEIVAAVCKTCNSLGEAIYVMTNRIKSAGDEIARNNLNIKTDNEYDSDGNYVF